MSDTHIKIFDTTLRDGEQAPGCSMTLSEKLRVAKALSELKVDIIEAGFPAASPGDFESVKAIAEQNLGPVICGLARCNAGDIQKVYEAVKYADKHRIHVFVATSAIHREHKLKMAKEEIIKSAVGAIKLARELVDDVEFSPEDASRTELSYLAEVVSAAIEAGATTVNIPDTVGYTVPAEFDRLFRYLKEHVARIDEITLSVHCHNDLGLAVANSLAAVRAGARQGQGEPLRARGRGRRGAAGARWSARQLQHRARGGMRCQGTALHCAVAACFGEEIAEVYVSPVVMAAIFAAAVYCVISTFPPSVSTESSAWLEVN